jgi:hypothetical protein
MEPRSRCYHCIQVFCRNDTTSDKAVGFAVDRSLEAICHKPRDLLVDMDRSFVERSVEVQRCHDGLMTGIGMRYDLN